MRDDQTEFHARLTIKRKELEDALNRLLKDQKEYHDQLAGDTIADESDSAQREISASSLYSLIDKKTHELRKTEYLIEKISRDEDFGICEECGDPIPTQRLLIVPEANLCVPCQQEEEKYYRSRNQGFNISNGFRSKKAFEWEQSDDEDTIDGKYTDSDLEIFQEIDMNPAETRESSPEYANITNTGKSRARQPKANRI